MVKVSGGSGCNSSIKEGGSKILLRLFNTRVQTVNYLYLHLQVRHLETFSMAKGKGTKRKMDDVVAEETTSEKVEEVVEEDDDSKKPQKKSKSDDTGVVTEEGAEVSGKKGKSAERSSIPRPLIERIPTPSSSGYAVKIITANVAGLRALLKGDKRDGLAKLVSEESPDILCVQEHKLQESHVDDVKADVEKLLPGYTQYYTCSTEKKGIKDEVSSFTFYVFPSHEPPSTCTS